MKNITKKILNFVLFLFVLVSILVLPNLVYAMQNNPNQASTNSQVQTNANSQAGVQNNNLVVNNQNGANQSAQPRRQVLENTWHFTDRDPEKLKEKLIKQEGFVEVNIETAVSLSLPIGENNIQEIPLTRDMLGQFIEAIPVQQREQFASQMGQLEAKFATIKGLFLRRQNARATIVCVPGFWPGVKENFAPIVKIFPNDCNLLFIELSGHGESVSRSLISGCSSCLGFPLDQNIPSCFGSNGLLTPNGGLFGLLGNSEPVKLIKHVLGLKEYGLHEHEQILGAINYVYAQAPESPIIMFGWCSGAIQTAQTLIKLRQYSPIFNQLRIIQEQDALGHFNIRGMIFDSGFGSFTDILPNFLEYFKREYFPCFFKEQKNDGKDEKSSWLSGITNIISKIFKPVISGITDLLYYVLNTIFGPSVIQNDPIINIYDKIDQIADLKTLFVHSNGDSLVPMACAKRIHDSMRPECRTFKNTPGDSHAKMQVKNKDWYKEIVGDWLTQTVGAYNPNVSHANSTNTSSGQGNPNRQVNNQNNQANRQNQNANNAQNPQRKINIERMIAIIDKVIGMLKGEVNSQNPDAQLQSLLTEFNTLLNDPVTNIPEKDKAKIEQNLQQIMTNMQKLAAAGNTIQQKDAIELMGKAFELLNEIREILLALINPGANKTGKNNVAEASAADAKKVQDELEKLKNNQDNKDDYDKYKPKDYAPSYYNPSSNSNGNSNSSSNSSSPKWSNSDNRPQNYSGSTGGSGSAGAGSNANHNGAGRGPSGTGSRFGGSGGSGYDFGGNNNPVGEPKVQEKPLMTEAEYMIYEQEQEDPELGDKPDFNRPFWMRMTDDMEG